MRLRQIFTNLVGNAVKFTREGGVLVELACTDGAVFFRVTDTGVGIPRDALPTLFDPFVQAAGGRELGGTGLGLSVCRQLVELMKGSIDVQSELGRGATFEVRLPLPRPPDHVSGGHGAPSSMVMWSTSTNDSSSGLNS